MAGLSNPLTLADWARRFAAASPADALRELASLPAEKRERLLHAQTLLSSSQEEVPGDALSIEELGGYLEGTLDAETAARVEQICWDTPSQLAELLSLASFAAAPVQAEVSGSLEARLLAIVPQQEAPAIAHDGESPKYRLVPVDHGKRNGKPASPPGEQRPRKSVSPPNGKPVAFKNVEISLGSSAIVNCLPPTNEPSSWIANHWLLAAAAIVLAMFLSAGAGWLAATRRSANSIEPLVHQSAPQPEPKAVTQQLPATKNPSRTSPEQPAITESEPVQQSIPVASDSTPITVERAVPNSLVMPFVPAPKSAMPRGAALPPPTDLGPRLPAPELAITSPQGVMLYDVGLRGTWRVARPRQPLAEPLRVLSLAESWTRVEVPEVGSLVFEGDAEASLAMLPDGTVEVRMAYGRLGVEDLRAGAKLRLVAGDTACTAQGIDPRSTLAMVCDPISPGLMVPEGALLVDHLEIREGQIIRWQDGLPQTATAVLPLDQGSLSAPATPTTPPVVNPWELSWLEPPGDAARKQWYLTYGDLAERLSKADDAGIELINLAESTREPRLAALAARWSMAANPGTRRSRVWNMLTDRRVAVRLAAVKCLLEAPPGDGRGIEFNLILREKLGESVADDIDQWLAATRQPGPPPRTQAAEIVEHLQHTELAVRQIAVSLLELHSSGALVQLGIRPPAYDPTARAARRAAGYAEWKAAMVQLYSPNRKFPAQPGAVQPQRQRALQNGAGGT